MVHAGSPSSTPKRPSASKHFSRAWEPRRLVMACGFTEHAPTARMAPSPTCPIPRVTPIWTCSPPTLCSSPATRAVLGNHRAPPWSALHPAVMKRLVEVPEALRPSPSIRLSRKSRQLRATDRVSPSTPKADLRQRRRWQTGAIKKGQLADRSRQPGVAEFLDGSDTGDARAPRGRAVVEDRWTVPATMTPALGRDMTPVPLPGIPL
jgi:hypothetical protein